MKDVDTTKCPAYIEVYTNKDGDDFYDECEIMNYATSCFSDENEHCMYRTLQHIKTFCEERKLCNNIIEPQEILDMIGKT